MRVKLQNALPPPSLEEVGKVEATLGLKLPTAYIEALAFCNGAISEPNVLEGSDQRYNVERFLELSELPHVKKLLDEFNPSTHAPIARAAGGDHICIATEGDRTGAILVADHEVPGDDAFSWVSDTLGSFLDGLVPFDIGTVILLPGQVRSAWIDPAFLKEIGLKQ